MSLQFLERDESGELEGSLKSRSKFISKDAIEVLADAALRAKSSVLFSQEFKNRLEKQEGKEIEKKAYQILEEFVVIFEFIPSGMRI